MLQVKDICNELDVRSLCHKILQNVTMLLRADRGSLFLVQSGRSDGGASPAASTSTSPSPSPASSSTSSLAPSSLGSPRPRMLVSKLFDVCSRSTLEEMEKKEEIRISWGTGIVGYVAESGEPVNIPDAYKVGPGANVQQCLIYFEA